MSDFLGFRSDKIRDDEYTQQQIKAIKAGDTNWDNRNTAPESSPTLVVTGIKQDINPVSPILLAQLVEKLAMLAMLNTFEQRDADKDVIMQARELLVRLYEGHSIRTIANG